MSRTPDLVKALRDHATPFRLAHAEAGQYTIEHGARRRTYPTAGMRAWLDGYLIGRVAPRRRRLSPRPDPAHLAAVRAVLINPVLVDLTRTQILLCMQDAGISLRQLAALTGRTGKAAGDALRYGSPSSLSFKVAQAMLQALTAGCWTLCSRPGDQDGPVPLVGADREPDGLIRARVMAWGHESGLFHWFGTRTGRTANPAQLHQPPHPTNCFYARGFVIGVDHVTYSPATPVLYPWLAGLLDAIAPEAAGLLLDAIGTEVAGRRKVVPPATTAGSAPGSAP